MAYNSQIEWMFYSILTHLPRLMGQFDADFKRAHKFAHSFLSTLLQCIAISSGITTTLETLKLKTPSLNIECLAQTFNQLNWYQSLAQICFFLFSCFDLSHLLHQSLIKITSQFMCAHQFQVNYFCAHTKIKWPRSKRKIWKDLHSHWVDFFQIQCSI